MKNRAKMQKKRIVKAHVKDVFTCEYERIVGINTNTILSPSNNENFQWRQKGDFFKKFTTFQEYTPVKTSGNTSLCK